MASPAPHRSSKQDGVDRTMIAADLQPPAADSQPPDLQGPTRRNALLIPTWGLRAFRSARICRAGFGANRPSCWAASPTPSGVPSHPQTALEDMYLPPSLQGLWLVRMRPVIGQLRSPSAFGRLRLRAVLGWGAHIRVVSTHVGASRTPPHRAAALRLPIPLDGRFVKLCLVERRGNCSDVTERERERERLRVVFGGGPRGEHVNSACGRASPGRQARARARRAHGWARGATSLYGRWRSSRHLPLVGERRRWSRHPAYSASAGGATL